MLLYSFVSVLCVLASTTAQSLDIERQTCSQSNQVATIQSGSQAMIGGLISMHNQGSNGYGCGSIQTGSMQSYEAIRWALDRLNKKDTVLNGENLTDSYIPGVKLGMMSYDYCDTNTLAVSRAQDMFPQFSSESRDCRANASQIMLGLIGASSSSATKDVNKFTGMFNIPLVSFMATSPDLSDNADYPYFMRTIPPDGPLMDGIVSLMGDIGWDYVVVVYTTDAYGSGAFAEIRPRIAAAGKCLTLAIATPADDITDTTLASVLARALATETTGVIYLGNQMVALKLLERAEAYPNAGNLQWIFTDSLPLSSRFTNKKYQRGVISVLSGSRKITEFEDHWVRIDPNNPSGENPWYKDWYMTENNCRLSSSTNPTFQSLPICPTILETDRRDSFVQDQFVEPAVHAVFGYASALRKAHLDKCLGAPGLCSNLSSMTTEEFYNSYLKNINFIYTKQERVESLASYGFEPYNAAAKVQFDANGDIIGPSYDIYNFNNDQGSGVFKFRWLGTYSADTKRLEILSNRLTMYDVTRDNSLSSVPTSTCPSSGCLPCLGELPDINYMYQPGDIVINGLFSLHLPGMAPLTCGNFDTNSRAGIQYMEAMFFALNEINTNIKLTQNILPGVTLGGLAFDDCMVKELGENLVSEVQRHDRIIMDGNGVALDPRTIESYMGSHSTGLTLPIAELMDTIMRPLIGYAGTSSQLEEYKFYRYMLSNYRYTYKALVLMLKRLGWHYVQVVVSNGEFFNNALNLFKTVATEEGVCVVASYRYVADGDMDMILDKLRRHSTVKPVVIISTGPDLRNYLTKVKEVSAIGEFTYALPVSAMFKAIGLFNGLEDVTEGMLAVDWTVPDISAFGTYLASLRPNTYTANPWFNEWYEVIYECSLDSNDMRKYTQVCADTFNKPITDKVLVSPVIFSVVYGVYAIAFSLHNTLIHYCGTNYNGVCGSFLNAADKGDILLQKINEVSFNVNNQFTFSFKDGVANFPFKYDNYQSGNFLKVGDYNFQTNQFSLNVDSISLYGGLKYNDITPHCPEVCTECLSAFSDLDYMYIPGDIIIPAIFDIHYPGSLPFLCGSIRYANGFQASEAFKFAIERINSGGSSVKLNNVKLGGIGFDGCMDMRRGLTIVSGLYAGLLPRDEKIPIERLFGWMTYANDLTIELASSNSFPMITPGATSAELDDKSKYQQFFRTIPSDSMRAKAMALTAKRLGFQYIITLNAPERGSRDAVGKFREYTTEQGICIGASYEFVTDGSMEQLIKYIVSSSSRIVAVFAEPDQYIEELLTAKSQNIDAVNIIFMSNRVWSSPMISQAALRYAVNALMFGRLPTPISEYRTYMSTLFPMTYTDNPWFYDFYQRYFSCDLGDGWQYGFQCLNPDTKAVTQGNFLEDIFVLPTIHAVTAIADAVHLTLMDKCGINYDGVCSRFLTDMDTTKVAMGYMDTMNFTDILGETFRFIQREANAGLSIYKLDTFTASINEGTFSSDAVILQNEASLIDTYRGVPSTCVGDCATCYVKGDGEIEFMYYPADIMIVGLFDVHKQGPTPYTCGEINHKHGLQLVEAFYYAIEYVNDKKGIFANMLQDVTIGGIALDICQSPIRAGNLIANIHSGMVELKNGNNVLNPDRFDAYIGTLDTESSIRVADVLNAIGMPQISYGATGLELQDTLDYRYFLRTVPADDKQARAIVSYLKRFDLKNVQVIHTFNSVGEYGREEFSRLAYLNSICISQNLTVGIDGIVDTTKAKVALDQLFLKPDAKIVILFVDNPRPFLEVIESNTTIRTFFRFIGTDKWGEDPDMWKGLTNIMRDGNVVTFDIETADLPDFDAYLEDKTPNDYTFNPWFDEYYELVYNCSLSGTSTQRPPCPSRQYGLPRSPNYVQDPYVLYVVNAVFSAAIGAHKALQAICPPDTRGVCNLFRTSGERRQEILNGAKQAMFIDATDQPFYYTAGGESDRGYHIWEPLPNPDGSGYYLEDVGSYNDTDYLKIDARYDPNWFSPCTGVASCQCVFPEYQPSRYMAKPSPNDLNIVYISDIHDANPSDPYSCGAIDTNGNFQNLMAFFYAINLVNGNTDLKLPASLKLGGIALDTCSTPSRIGQDLYSVLSGEGICGAEGLGQVLDPSTVVVYLAKNSQNAIVTSSILSPLHGTSMSQSATSVELSDKNYHSYFLRTVPPDDIQAVVMAQVISSFGWDYVSAVYSDNAYGRAAVRTFLETSQNSKPRTCATLSISMAMDATVDDAKAIIDDLNQRVGARVVVLFVTSDHSRLLLRATAERGVKNRFIWFGSDTWANSMAVVKDYEDVAVGALTIQIRSEILTEFNTFLKSLTLQNEFGLPTDWFQDIYQTLHQCRILNSVVSKTYTRICSGDEQVTDDMVSQDPYVLHTIISVFMVAQGLNRIEQCKNSPLDLSACLSLQPDKNDLIYNGIAGGQYSVLPGLLGDDSFVFKFTDSGYGDIGYNVLNFQRDLTTGQFVYEKIGSYQQELVMDRTKYKGFSFVDSRSAPVSQCPVGSTCQCVTYDGTPYSYTREGGVSGFSYYVLEDGSYVNSQTGQVVQIEQTPEMEDRFRDVWGIIVATLAGLGVFASLCVFIYLLVVYPVRSGTTVLGYMLAFGIVLAYALVFAFIVHASEEVCGLRRFCLGLVYAICYCSLFVKLVDCWRSKSKDDIYAVKYVKLGRPLGFFFVACLLVLVQCMISAEWLILVPPKMERVIYNSMLWPRCMPDDFYDEGLVLSLVYVMFIMLLSIIIGFLSWKSTKNHRESRWILGIFVLGIPVWVVFCVVASLGVYKMRDAAVAIGLLVNASIMFVLGPLRKLYLLNKYEALMEEEDRKSALEHGSQRGDYASSMYGRQYDNVAQLHDTNSMRGSMFASEQMAYTDQRTPY